jgi:hypothetical protein
MGQQTAEQQTELAIVGGLGICTKDYSPEVGMATGISCPPAELDLRRFTATWAFFVTYPAFGE